MRKIFCLVFFRLTFLCECAPALRLKIWQKSLPSLGIFLFITILSHIPEQLSSEKKWDSDYTPCAKICQAKNAQYMQKKCTLSRKTLPHMRPQYTTKIHNMQAQKIAHVKQKICRPRCEKYVQSPLQKMQSMLQRKKYAGCVAKKILAVLRVCRLYCGCCKRSCRRVKYAPQTSTMIHYSPQITRHITAT